MQPIENDIATPKALNVNPEVLPALETTPEWWAAQATLAREAMLSSPSTRRALIEVAAQHPLVENTVPGEEFSARLDRGVELAKELTQEGWAVSMYVPGSRHQEGSSVDSISLSEAGTAYLRSRVPHGVSVHGDDLNDRYLPDSGVFGSADECFVTAEFFREGSFERLLAIVSPQQLPRKLLHYIAFGVEPLLHTAPVRQPYHRIVHELTISVPEVLTQDPRAQGPNSPIAARLRKSRRPR